MRAPSSRTRRIISLSVAPVAVLLAGLMVWQGSNAAFSSHTRNIGNSWETGSVELTDDDGGDAMFQIQNATPGDTGEKCIRVTSTSNVPGVVKLHVEDLAANGLEDYIQLKMETGTSGTFGSCAGFVPSAEEASQPLSTLMADHSSYATGLLPWVTAGVTSSKTYRFTWVFDTGILDQTGINALQGEAASINIAWELQNT